MDREGHLTAQSKLTARDVVSARHKRACAPRGGDARPELMLERHIQCLRAQHTSSERAGANALARTSGLDPHLFLGWQRAFRRQASTTLSVGYGARTAELSKIGKDLICFELGETTRSGDGLLRPKIRVCHLAEVQRHPPECPLPRHGKDEPVDLRQVR